RTKGSPTRGDDPFMEPLDPFEAHLQREPRSTSGVHVLVISIDEPERADAIASGLVSLLTERGRRAAAEIVLCDKSFGLPRADALAIDTEHDLVLVTTATAPWNAEHLDPLLKAIDHCDHIFGRRQLPFGGRLSRWLGRLPWKLLFA